MHADDPRRSSATCPKVAGTNTPARAGKSQAWIVGFIYSVYAVLRKKTDKSLIRQKFFTLEVRWFGNCSLFDDFDQIDRGEQMQALKLWGGAVAATVAMVGAAQAALIDRGGGMIYDTTRDITWLADMNYAKTSGYAATHAGGTGSNLIVSDGRMGWNAAVAWADQLVFGGFSDWRLPTLNPGDTSCSDILDPTHLLGFPIQHVGVGCTGGELSGLFVTDLGNKARESVKNQVGDTAEQIANLAMFSNVQFFGGYWSGTEFAPDTNYAWRFFAGSGNQFETGKASVYLDLFTYYAVAVRSGDVIASVPEPQTLALFLLGLGTMGVVCRKRSL